MADAVSASMQARTGRTVSEWVDAVTAAGIDPLDQLAVRRWLKDTHGIAQNSQWTIAFAAAEAAGWVRPSADGYTDTLYAGAKAPLRPLHDAVLGVGAEREGRSTYIPVVRATQFAAIAPGPGGTLRVGLRFRTQVPDDARLEPAKGFAQATHWVHLPGASLLADAAALEPLLAAAYLQNG